MSRGYKELSGNYFTPKRFDHVPLDGRSPQ